MVQSTMFRVLTVSLTLTVAACSSPTQPDVSVAGARPVGSPGETQISYYSQPVTLVVTPGVATGGVTPTSTVEIATDAAFTAVVSTQSLAPSTTGQVTLVVDHLSPATTYYWRVKTTAGNNPGVTSSPQSFSIGPLLVFQPPTPVQPLADTFPHKRPTFVVTNAARTGPPATVTYRFDVATDATFTTIVATGTVPEASAQTSFTPNIDLTSGATYFWRAQASDATKNVLGPFSSGQAFTTVFPEDGTYRYTLAVHSPAYCVTHYTHSSPCDGDFGWVQSDFSFDGTLVITGDTLQYSVPPSGTAFNDAPLSLGVHRGSNKLTGTVRGTPALVPPVPTHYGVVSAVLFGGAQSNTVTGQSDNAGSFAGTFDGTLSLFRWGFPCDHTSTCSAYGFTWTLTPHP